MILPKKKRWGSLRSTLRDPRGLCHDVGVVALWRNRYLVVAPQLRPWQELLPYRRCAPAWLLPVCLEQAVQRPTRHRERRCLSHGHNKALAVLTRSVAPLGRRSSPVCESRPNRHCLFQTVAHQSGRRGSDRSRHTQSTARPRQGQRENLWRSHTARIWANVRAPVRFGPPRTACSGMAHGFGSRPAEQGHPRVPVRAAGKSTVPEPSATAAEPFSTLRLGAGTTTLPLSSSVKGPDPPSLSVKESVPE